MRVQEIRTIAVQRAVVGGGILQEFSKLLAKRGGVNVQDRRPNDAECECAECEDVSARA